MISSTLQKLPILSTITPQVRPVLVGYWHNWHTEAAPFLPLRKVPGSFDIINVAFAIADEQSPGKVVFDPCGQTTRDEMKSDIAALQSAGQRVLLSVGGATGSLALENLPAYHNFVDSLTRLVEIYGFNGLDINLEGVVRLDAEETDFQNPCSRSVIYLVEALRRLKRYFGDQFMLTLAPQVDWVQGGCQRYEGLYGAYLPVIEQLRNVLDYVHVQHYNTTPQQAPDGLVYMPDELEFHYAMADMLLHGFPVAGNPAHFFSGLNANQLGIGLSTRKEIIENGYLAPEDLSFLLSRLNGDLGAIMLWSINWDAVNQGLFSKAARNYLDRL